MKLLVDSKVEGISDVDVVEAVVDIEAVDVCVGFEDAWTEAVVDDKTEGVCEVDASVEVSYAAVVDKVDLEVVDETIVEVVGIVVWVPDTNGDDVDKAGGVKVVDSDAVEASRVVGDAAADFVSGVDGVS